MALKDKRILLTNPHTRLGQHVLAALNDTPPKLVFAVDPRQFDLVHEPEVQRMYENAAAGSDTVVIHVMRRIQDTLNGNEHAFYYALVSNAFVMEHAKWNKVGGCVFVCGSLYSGDLVRHGYNQALLDVARAQAGAYKQGLPDGFEVEFWFPETSGEEKVEARIREYIACYNGGK